jgi:predicted nucleotidyltransferase
MSPSADLFGPIADTLRKAAAILREAEVPFMLGGSLAAWARGGKETTKDLDLLVKPSDAERALEALVSSGMRAERPPEEWLLKAYDGDVLVDLIFQPAGFEVTDEVLGRADEMTVASVTMRVMSLEDMLATKLTSLGEHHLDYEPILQTARSVREQIDWDAVREHTRGSPYARAFFVLVEGLGIAPPAGPGEHRGERETGVDVRPVAEDGREDRPTLGPEPHAVH